MLRTLRSFARIVDYQTVAVASLAMLATFTAHKMGWAMQLPEGLIAIAIIFPLGFAINAAFSRREKVLEAYASLKGAGVMLYFQHRDWLDPVVPEVLERSRVLTRELLREINNYMRRRQPTDIDAVPVYAAFAELSGLSENIRQSGAYPSDAARVNRGLAMMAVDFEKMRNIRNYRTPASLRAYSQLFLNLLPILFAPHFAFLAEREGVAVSLVVAAVYATLLVSLDNIQEALEDPFDDRGEDDVSLDAVEFFDRTIHATARLGRSEALQVVAL
ncbi:MAG TPA: hypothetical protein VGC44_05890 [Longimicrobiales bacterium]